MSTPVPVLAERFGLPVIPDLPPRFNIAPTQSVAVIRSDPAGRELALLRWGLVPPWADSPKSGGLLINARSETVAQKPSFRTALKARRCLILADGFFEWQPRDGKKQPWLFRLRDREPFGIAGVWERWHEPDGRMLESCALITTDANELVRPVHDRMPVILSPGAYPAWLDSGITTSEPLLPLLRPYTSAGMMAVPVSSKVNSPRFDDPSCLDEAGSAEAG